jgi:hypothetical protein
VITLIRSVAARARGSALVSLLVLAAGISGCGASGHSATPAAPRSVCEEISAVLSDGPDPGADPVGYAEAQILPLRQIRTGDRALARAIADLSAAYRRFFDSNGASAAAKLAVVTASKRVNSFCPGAASS